MFEEVTLRIPPFLMTSTVPGSGYRNAAGILTNLGNFILYRELSFQGIGPALGVGDACRKQAGDNYCNCL